MIGSRVTDEPIGRAFDPEAELGARGVTIEDVDDLPVLAAYVRSERIRVIAVRSGIDRVVRRCILAEELVHDELAWVWPSFGRPPKRHIRHLVWEEHQAHRIAARRLMSDSDAAEANRLIVAGEPREAVATKFEVTVEVLGRRLSYWRHPTGRPIGGR